jgi:hypothetical protein
MKYALLALLLYIYSGITAQTANIIIRTKDSLYVAADSRVVDVNNNKFDTICKIIKTGHGYFTFAGYIFEAPLPTSANILTANNPSPSSPNNT